MSEVTVILNRAQQGDPKAAEELLPLVYGELRKLAAARMADEPDGQTLQPTALVHEAWLRLVGHEQSSEGHSWNGRGHFFGAAAEAMRRILVESARRKARARHGGQMHRIDLTSLDLASTSDDDAVLSVSEALDKLAARDPVGAELVKLRFFVGVSQTEAAQLLGLPERTAGRTWAFARAWLYEELRKDR
jgi:RNA polymerase sigma factor (TIGR02999 family)